MPTTMPTTGKRTVRRIGSEAVRNAVRVRWARTVAAVAIPALLVTARLPEDPAPIIPPAALAILLFCVLLLVDLVDPSRLGMVGRVSLRRWSVIGLVVDTAAVVSVVWLAGVDPRGSLWVLLVLPILEAALRFGTRMSVLVLGLMVGVYIARDVWSAARYPAVTFSPATVVQRVGVLIVVGMVAGFLAAQLAREARRHRAVRSQAVRRAQVMATVAEATRELTSLDPDAVYTNLVGAALRLGAEGAGVAVVDERGHWVTRPTTGADPGLAQVAMMIGPDLTSGDSTDIVTLGPEAVARMAGASQRYTAAQVLAVDGGERVVAALAVGGVVSDQILSALDLLIRHAGTVLAQARAFEEIRVLKERLAHQAFHDSLTGLPNRAEFDQRLRRRTERRTAAGTGLAVLFIDLDGFKAVNDTLGHEAGDVLLEEVAFRIRRTVRPGDTVARLGGDEFVVLLERVDDEGAARAAARRILAALDRPVRLGRHEVSISASIGIAFRPSAPADPEELVRRADRAMYEAKRTGKGRIVAIDAAIDGDHSAVPRLRRVG